MEITRCFIVILAMILYAEAHQHQPLSAYDAMQCLLHSSSDEPDACLLGGHHTRCTTFKCFLTVGQTCTKNEHEANLTGRECAKTLFCGCDSKCNGCMFVNGVQICHRADCMALGKRNQMKGLPMDTHDKSIEYPVDDTLLI